MSSGEVLDAAGNPTSGSAESVARVDQALDLLLPYDPDLLGAAGDDFS